MLDNQPIIRSATNTPTESRESSTIVLLPEHVLTQDELDSAFKPLSGEYKCFGLLSGLPTGFEVDDFVERLDRALLATGIKRVTLLAVGSAAGIAQAFAVRFPKTVRRMVLVDAQTRVRPNAATVLVDRVEKLLPLGLPLRALDRSFDSRSFLHRIHCPVLVLQTPCAGKHVAEQFALITKRVPNAWGKVLNGPCYTAQGELSAEIAELVSSFLQTPAKRPRK